MGSQIVYAITRTKAPLDEVEWEPVDGEPGCVIEQFNPAPLATLQPTPIVDEIVGAGRKKKKTRSPRGTMRRDPDFGSTMAIGDARARGWRERKALKAAYRAELEAINKLDAPKEIKNDLPEPMRRRDSWGKLTRNGFWGPMGPGVGWHVTSAKRFGVALPFLAPMTTNIAGPVIGIETSTGQPFTWDPWEPVRMTLVSSPHVVTIGNMGFGKSWDAKTRAIRAIENGRHVIVCADPKEEWAFLCEILGGQLIAVGPGSGNVINPLDEGVRPVGIISEAKWRAMVIERRTIAIEGICAALRTSDTEQTSAALKPNELAVIACLCEAMADGLIYPTIQGVLTTLKGKDRSWLGDLEMLVPNEAIVDLILTLSLLTRGALAGMFDTDSTVKLDPAAPMVVISTKRLASSGDKAKQIAAAATSAWIDATLRSGDGRWRILMEEEAWDAWSIPANAKATDYRMRLTSELRCAVWANIHEISDINKFGGPDSQHRNIVKGVITKAQTKILFNQTTESVNTLGEFVTLTESEKGHLTKLVRGEAIWHIGQESPLGVQAKVGPRLARILSTSAGRDGVIEAEIIYEGDNPADAEAVEIDEVVEAEVYEKVA